MWKCFGTVLNGTSYSAGMRLRFIIPVSSEKSVNSSLDTKIWDGIYPMMRGHGAVMSLSRTVTSAPLSATAAPSGRRGRQWRHGGEIVPFTSHFLSTGNSSSSHSHSLPLRF